MILKLKPQFKGLAISKNIFPIGLVTLDTNTVKQSDYLAYSKLGFQDIFDEVEETTDEPTILNPTIEPIKPTQPIDLTKVDGLSEEDIENYKTQNKLNEEFPSFVVKYYTNEQNQPKQDGKTTKTKGRPSKK